MEECEVHVCECVGYWEPGRNVIISRNNFVVAIVSSTLQPDDDNIH